MKHYLESLIAGIAFFLLISCMLQDPNSPEEGTDIGNPVGYGIIHTAQGNPVEGAIVTLGYTNVENPSKVNRVSLVTDKKGRYPLSESMKNSRLELTAEKNGQKAFHDSLYFKMENEVVSIDTLKTPGSIMGKIQLRPNDDPRTCLILFDQLQWSYFLTDSSGNFVLKDLAEGKYNVRILSTLDGYSPIDTMFKIKSGSVDTLKNSIRLSYSGLPQIDTISVTYNKFTRRAHIKWSSPDSSRIKLYRVEDQNPSGQNWSGIKVTSSSEIDELISSNWERHFRVAAEDSSGNLGKWKLSSIFYPTDILTKVDSFEIFPEQLKPLKINYIRLLSGNRILGIRENKLPIILNRKLEIVTTFSVPKDIPTPPGYFSLLEGDNYVCYSKNEVWRFNSTGTLDEYFKDSTLEIRAATQKGFIYFDKYNVKNPYVQPFLEAAYVYRGKGSIANNLDTVAVRNFPSFPYGLYQSGDTIFIGNTLYSTEMKKLSGNPFWKETFEQYREVYNINKLLDGKWIIHNYVFNSKQELIGQTGYYSILYSTQPEEGWWAQSEEIKDGIQKPKYYLLKLDPALGL